MIDYNEMIKNESMEDVILFLVARRESGLIYPAIDRFFIAIMGRINMSRIIL